MPVELRDYYQDLKLPWNASELEIRASYRRLAVKHHPDKNLDHKNEAEGRFKEINAAYEVLSDSEKRKQYHRQWQAERDQSDGVGCNAEFIHFPTQVLSASFWRRPVLRAMGSGFAAVILYQVYGLLKSCNYSVYEQMGVSAFIFCATATFVKVFTVEEAVVTENQNSVFTV